MSRNFQFLQHISGKVRLWEAVLNKRTFPVPDLVYRNI
jgi:hypothetical protein